MLHRWRSDVSACDDDVILEIDSKVYSDRHPCTLHTALIWLYVPKHIDWRFRVRAIMAKVMLRVFRIFQPGPEDRLMRRYSQPRASDILAGIFCIPEHWPLGSASLSVWQLIRPFEGIKWLRSTQNVQSRFYKLVGHKFWMRHLFLIRDVCNMFSKISPFREIDFSYWFRRSAPANSCTGCSLD